MDLEDKYFNMRNTCWIDNIVQRNKFGASNLAIIKERDFTAILTKSDMLT